VLLLVLEVDGDRYRFVLFSIAAQDVLTLPSLTVGTASRGAMPEVIGFFNQIKQEFVSARYLYYEGLHAKGIHFCD